MMTPPKTTLNQMLKAWQKQVHATADKPWLFTLLMRQWARLFRRFAHYYQRLLALPRPHKRALKRKLATTLAGAALLLALGQTLPARAAVITVDGVVCTLAEAIDSANNDNAAGNGCVDGNGADVIDLQTDVLLSAALPAITSEITLEGNGHTIDGNDAFQVLNVQVTGNLTLNDATVSGGYDFFSGGGISNNGTLTVNNSILSSNYGSGIYNKIGGALTVNNSIVSGNYAFFGGGIYNGGTAEMNNCIVSGNWATFDGGIENVGTLAVNNSMISDNVGLEGGGGIFNGGTGTVAVNNSTISSNFGGGIGNGDTGTVTVNGSTISGNSAIHGGAILNIQDGMVTVNNSTLSGNSAPYGDGGGIWNWGGSVTVNNSTISGNSASYNGGGIHNGTISFGGIVNLNRSVISGNQAANGPEIFIQNGTVTANNYNVIGYDGDPRSVAFTPGPNDIIPPGALDTVLDTTLADNGGPTFTHALVSGSVAIDAAPSTPCLAPPINGLDQRGFPRNVDGDGAPSANECDAGAFELAPSGKPTRTPTPTKTPLPTRTPTPRPTRTPTPIVAPESALVVPAQKQAANPLMNMVIVTSLALGNLLWFRKGRACE